MAEKLASLEKKGSGVGVIDVNVSNIKALAAGANTITGLTVGDYIGIRYVMSGTATKPTNVSGMSLVDSVVYQGDDHYYSSLLQFVYKATSTSVSFIVPQTIMTTIAYACYAIY